jgi:uncharacterized protein (TIGR00369 family)
MTDATERAEKLARLDQGFSQAIPHNRALGLKFEDFAEGVATMRLPYSEKLVGNPRTGIMHGGAVTSLLDAACGAAVFLKLGRPASIATLDLRIDYLKQATSHEDVLCRTECYRVTRHIAFVRGLAYHQDPDDPIASVSGTFMLQTRGKPIAGRGT